jgi:hypothetical protein
MTRQWHRLAELRLLWAKESIANTQCTFLLKISKSWTILSLFPSKQSTFLNFTSLLHFLTDRISICDRLYIKKGSQSLTSKCRFGWASKTAKFAMFWCQKCSISISMDTKFEDFIGLSIFHPTGEPLLQIVGIELTFCDSSKCFPTTVCPLYL